MKVIETGSNGFVGSRLKTRLEHEVGQVVSIPHEQIQTQEIGPFDYFYFLSTFGNLASQKETGPQETSKIVRANITDLTSVLDRLPKDFKSFVFMSSSSVGLKRQTTYSRTKRAAEEILLAYREKYQLPICIVRPFSITGVGEQAEHLIPTLIRSCLTGEPMPFVAEPTHDFIDVDDVVSGIITLSKQGAGGIYDLGTGKSHTNQEVREIVERVTGKRANITMVEQLRGYDNREWVSTNPRARGFGWMPAKTLEQSITEMVRKAQNVA